MAAPPSPPAPHAVPGLGQRGMAGDGDVLIALAVLGVAAAVVAMAQGGLWPLPWPPHSLKLRCLAVLCIGGAVGFAELVSRYRDEPWQAAATPPGLTYIALNAGCGLIGLLLMEHFPQQTASPDDGVARVLVAGTGAMVVLRSKLFTLRQAEGEEIAVGPALALDQVLNAVNRDIDRRRAARRHRLVTMAAEALAPYDFAESVRFLRPALLAFQTLEQSERTALNASLAELQRDPDIAAQPSTIKYKYFFFDLLTTCGEQTFNAIYADLLTHLRAMPIPAPAAAPAPPAPGTVASP